MSVPEWTNPPGVYAPQAHYSQVARIDKTLYISGQLGLDENGELVGPGNAQAHFSVGLRAKYSVFKEQTWASAWGGT